MHRAAMLARSVARAHALGANITQVCRVRCLSSRVSVYTRTGDKGQSSLFNGERRPKDDAVFEALGTTDELNAHIGLAREESAAALEEEHIRRLDKIQSLLLDVGSALATPCTSSSVNHLARAEFGSGHAERLEQWIDEMDEDLPPLKNFILPSGGRAAAQLHVARTVCRRAERAIVPLVETGSTPPHVLQFINRLSDFLFVSARFVAARTGHSEVTYKKVKESKNEADRA